MALTQRLEMRQGHALVMTPQLMQAIKLLQLSSLDLAAYVEEELERNPLLERAGENEAPMEAGESARQEDDQPSGGEGSEETSFESIDDDLVDESGYMTGDLLAVAEKLAAPLADIEIVLGVLQGFDPPGVCARNLTECLAIQLRELDRFDPAMAALVTHLDLLAKRDFSA